LTIITKENNDIISDILQIMGTVDFTNDNAINAIVNRVYTARKDNEIIITSNVGNGDWIQCKWTTTQRKNTTDFKREIPSFKNTTN
jgi:hypothetical protein